MKIVIKELDKPDSENYEIIVGWFCQAFGLGSENDYSIEAKILESLAKAAYNNNKGMTSMEIKKELGDDIGRTTIIYHLNKFIQSGLVVKRGRKYYLRSSSMYKAIEELEYDLDKEMKKMLDVAKEFDKMMSSKSLSNE
ncbi:MAG: winged helix-turn-helix domain-containing protein [Candidatus Micrarchaeia archaeon]